MALFKKASIQVDEPQLLEVSDLIRAVSKRVKSLEHIEKEINLDVSEREVMLKMDLSQNLEDAALLKLEINSIKGDIKRKSAIIGRVIAELKQCVLDTEFNDVKKKIEMRDPVEMITRKEFENEAERRLGVKI